MTKQLNIDDIRSQIEAASEVAQSFLAQDGNEAPIKAWLPSGVIRKISDLEGRWPYLDYSQRRTCACVLQLCDVNKWFMNIYRVGLTAGTMFVWHNSIPVIALIETLLYQVGRKENWVKEDAHFKKCINTLHSKGIYNRKFTDKLHELRFWRNDIHLHTRDERVDVHEGKPKMYNFAVVRLRALEKLLKNHYESNRK